MKSSLKYLPSVLLILLFAYAAVSKLASFNDFRLQLYRQPISHEVSAMLVYAIPATEMIVIILLSFKKVMLHGLYLSLSLLSVFSLYISLVLLHFWSRVPCSCGGILNHMSWSVHLVFNLAFIVLNLIAIHIHLKERRPVTGD
jgi:putative oxidoreductase